MGLRPARTAESPRPRDVVRRVLCRNTNCHPPRRRVPHARRLFSLMAWGLSGPASARFVRGAPGRTRHGTILHYATGGTCDAGFMCRQLWQRTVKPPKSDPSRKLLLPRNLRRVTRWHRVTRIRESETISTRFGPVGRMTASRDLATATITASRGQACRHHETMPRFPRKREEKVERRPQESGEGLSEFSSALLSPFSTLLLYCRGAAMEAAAKTRNGYHITVADSGRYPLDMRCHVYCPFLIPFL